MPKCAGPPNLVRPVATKPTAAAIQSKRRIQGHDGRLRIPGAELWVFGEAHHYLVNEARNTEIFMIMAPDMPAWRRTTIIEALILGPGFWVFAVPTLRKFEQGRDSRRHRLYWDERTEQET